MLLSEIINYTHKIKKIELKNDNKESLYKTIITKINLPTNDDEVVRFSLDEKSNFIAHQKKDNDYFLRISNNLNNTTTLYAHFFPKELYTYTEQQQIFSEYDLRQLHHPETDNYYKTSIQNGKLYVQSTLNDNGNEIIKDPNYKNFTNTNIQKNISDMTEQGEFPLSTIFRPPYQYINAPQLDENPLWIGEERESPHWERFIHRSRLSPLISEGVENTGEDTPLNVYFNYQYLPTSTDYHEHRYGFQGADEHGHPDDKASYYNVLEGEKLNILHQDFNLQDNYRVIPNKNPFDESHTMNIPKEHIIDIELDSNSVITNGCTLQKNKCKNYYIYKENQLSTNCIRYVNLTQDDIYTLKYYIYIPEGTINNNGCYISINDKKIPNNFLTYDMELKNQWIYHEIPFYGEETNIIKICGPQANILDNDIYFANVQIKKFPEYSPLMKYNLSGLYVMEQDKYIYQKPGQTTTKNITTSTKEYKKQHKNIETPLGRVYFVFDYGNFILYDERNGSLMYQHDKNNLIEFNKNTNILTQKTKNNNILVQYFGGTSPNYDEKNAGLLTYDLIDEMNFTDGPNNEFTLKVKDTYDNVVNSGTVTCDITEYATYDIDNENVIKHLGTCDVINGSVFFNHINFKKLVPESKDYKIYFLRMIYEDKCYDETVIDYKKIIIHHIDYTMTYTVNGSSDITKINNVEQLPVKITAIIHDQLNHIINDGYVELSVDDTVVQDTIVDEDGTADFYLDLEDLKQGEQVIKLEYFTKFYIPVVVEYFTLSVDVDSRPTVPIEIKILNKHNENNNYSMKNDNILLFYIDFQNTSGYVLTISRNDNVIKTIKVVESMEDIYFFDIINEKNKDIIDYQFKVNENEKYRSNIVDFHVHLLY